MIFDFPSILINSIQLELALLIFLNSSPQSAKAQGPIRRLVGGRKVTLSTMSTPLIPDTYKQITFHEKNFLNNKKLCIDVISQNNRRSSISIWVKTVSYLSNINISSSAFDAS